MELTDYNPSARHSTPRGKKTDHPLTFTIQCFTASFGATALAMRLWNFVGLQLHLKSVSPSLHFDVRTVGMAVGITLFLVFIAALIAGGKSSGVHRK